MVTKQFKLSVKSQVTIPESVKNILGIGPGDTICFSVEKGHVEVLPVKEEKLSIFELGAKYKTVPKKKVSISDMDKAIKAGQRRTARKNI